MLGVVLRLYMIEDQILLDDEWHALNLIINKPFMHVLTSYGYTGTNCPPLHIYSWLLLKTIGLSEMWLKFPALAAGMGSLVIFPLLLRRIVGRRLAILFSFLFAISPYLIFYSRVSRGYSEVALLCFFALLSLYVWVIEGTRRWAVLYIMAGALAISFHLWAIIPVLTPLGCVVCVILVRGLTHFSIGRIRIVPSIAAVAWVGIGVLLVAALLVVLILARAGPPEREGCRVTWDSFLRFTCLLSGTHRPPLAVLFWALLIIGQAVLVRRNTLFGFMSLCSLVLLYLPLTIARWPGISAPIVLARYIIAVFPLSFICVAAGLDSIADRISGIMGCRSGDGKGLIGNLVAALFISALLFSGPLMRIYTSPNNFTNHSAFQESYKPITWVQSYNSDIVPGYFVVKKTEIPSFYLWLGQQTNVCTIIEYPMSVCDHENLYYYFQHFHRKYVVAGFIGARDLVRYTVMRGITQSGLLCPAQPWYFDYVLSKASDERRLKFRNMIDVMNIELLKKSRASFIVLHKDIREYKDAYGSGEGMLMAYQPVLSLSYIYKRHFGLPVFEDNSIVVFRIAHKY